MIEYIEIKGFKSIKDLELDMKPINILIGSNGVGKSNFISFFKLLNAIISKQLQRYLLEEQVDDILHFGRKTTKMLSGKILFNSGNKNNNSYYFELIQNTVGGLFIGKEGSGFNVMRTDNQHNYFTDYNIEESLIGNSNNFRDKYLIEHLKKLQIFHFHDTSSTSLLRKECDIEDNIYLKNDGRNLPAFLYLLKVNNPIIFRRIEKVIQSIAPYFDKFILEPKKLKNQESKIALRWVDKGDMESSFSAYQLSDGTIRFIALAVLLLQPNPPSVIIIDEPELGLHPFAINVLAGMIEIASTSSQVIVATQSPGLISNFKPEDILVMDKKVMENETVIERLDGKQLSIWLADYSMGDLWERNILNSAQPFFKK